MQRRFAFAWVVVLAALVAAGCGQFGKAANQDSDRQARDRENSTSRISDKPFDQAERKRAGCEEVEEMENKGREHVDGDVDYEDNPPTSGDHNGQPIEWGIWDEDQPTEKLVHNLEHGHVVIAYKGLSGAEYRELERHIKRDAFHIVLVPRKANPKDGIWYLAWENRMFCENPSAPALQFFVNAYRDQAPELFMQDPKKSGD